MNVDWLSIVLLKLDPLSSIDSLNVEWMNIDLLNLDPLSIDSLNQNTLSVFILISERNNYFVDVDVVDVVDCCC